MTQNDLRKKYPYYDQIQRFRLIDDTFMSVVFRHRLYAVPDSYTSAE